MSEPGSLAELGEFGLIDRVTRDMTAGPQVVVGPGDGVGRHDG